MTSSVGLGRLGLWWLLAFGCVSALAVLAAGAPRLGGNILAASFVGAAVLRLVLPTSLVGGLAIRPRALDVVMYLTFALVVLVGSNAVNWHPPR
ncbi:DUF3017 domain-containing protein [Arsenicicoccus dermatophilus]|uniref:DUF3017 domain-containing protein n=1 Tax=Arsenicicoccus dermatophilus TaxID=1076331 RepID=UPI001F4C9468|nr:DUF3017 domain-containing protein [Arsenicicoccus dermatophilus]MCH8612239.1 DUF3017 domain-containing protein [Arsenicicoccus dermatophilus]